MTTFFDLPESKRMDLYQKIEECGGSFLSGAGQYIAVAKGHYHEILAVMLKTGLETRELYKFPLGSDRPNVPALNHDGYWLYQRFAVQEHREGESAW